MKGSIRQRGKESWELRLFLGTDAQGKKLYKSHSVKGTRKEAERKLNELQHSLNTGAYVEPSRQTVASYLEQWLQDYARQNVAAKTLERYAGIVHQHLIPALGSQMLTKMTPMHIQGYYSRALESGRLDGGGGLSAQTVLHHHRVLRAALQQAVKWQLLIRNPADAVEPPRPAHREMRTFDEQEVNQLLQGLDRDGYYMPILIGIATGLRRGEVLGLRWQDLDLPAAKLAVRQSLEQTRTGVAFKQPKTRKGTRVVSLPPAVVDALLHHRQRQNQDRALMGKDYEDYDLVCAQPDGKPIKGDNLTHAYLGRLKRLGLRRVPLHGLRHTHATVLLRQGVHPKVVSERLGHANIGITLDIYSHVLPDMQEEAAQKLDQVLGQSIRQSKDP